MSNIQFLLAIPFFIFSHHVNISDVSHVLTDNPNVDHYIVEKISENNEYISKKFGLKIHHMGTENEYIIEGDNEIFIAFLQSQEKIKDLASCNQFYSTIWNQEKPCIQIDDQIYSVGEIMSIIDVDKTLSLEENMRQILLNKGKDPMDCSLRIVEKDSWSSEYNQDSALRISFDHLRDEANKIYEEARLMFEDESSIEYKLALIGAYKKLLRDDDTEILEMLLFVEKSLEEGREDEYLDMFMGNDFWGPLRQKRCGVFSGQFLTNWKPGHLIYFPQRPDIVVTMHGLSGGAGPDLYEVELVD